MNFQRGLGAVLKMLMVVGLGFGLASDLKAAAEALPGFAYRDVQLRFTQADGKPVADASIYGWCRELNLIWPRRDHEFTGRNDVLWDESFLGKTGSDGLVKATLPPGKWGFFAVGHAGEGDGTVVAGWTDFAERKSGEVIRLEPAVNKRWTFCFTNGSEALRPKRIFLKPAGFPVWIPTSVFGTNDALALAIPSNSFQLWAAGEAGAGKPGFALSWGTLGGETHDGKIVAAGGVAGVDCKGVKGKVSVSWTRRQNYGLEGELNFTNDVKILLTSGMFTIGYRRPITTDVMGDFVGQLYNFGDGAELTLKMDAPLAAGLMQGLSKPDATGACKLAGQLCAVDGNGHLLRELTDDRHAPANPEVAVTLNGQRFMARPLLHEVGTAEAEEEGEDEPATETSGQMLFFAPVGRINSAAGAVWEFDGPPGVFTHLQLSGEQEMVNVASGTFQMAVPRVMAPDAKNVLAQADMLAAAMNNASGKRRKVERTVVTIRPASKGAAAAHNGSALAMPPVWLFSDDPIAGHTIAHELGHDYGFRHGGLHETIVEVSRCAGAEQITQQPAKWMFLDRMNGVPTPEVPPHYPNKGLYLYCYAQSGLNFLHFLAAVEPAAQHRLAKQGFTTDELTVALLNLAMARDMTAICRNYGLNFTSERVAQAEQAVRVVRESLARGE